MTSTSVMSPSRLVFLVAACLAATATAFGAQAARGTISGTVMGDRDDRLAGVVVTAQNRATGVTTTTMTDAEGRYQIADLPIEGEYQVRVALAGFTPPAGENVMLVANAILVVNFRLKLAVTESVAVNVAAPIIETSRTAVQQTVDEQLVRNLPLLGRSFIPLASIAAGFTGNPNFPNPLGQMFWTNNILVDGASHFSKWRSGPRSFYSGYPLESIKEVQILTGRFSAEYGDALAAVTRATTKAGTDEYHGSGLLYLQHDKLNSTPAFALLNPPASTEQYGFTVGGPLGGHDTHFFESYEGRRARNKNIVASPDAAGSLARDDQDEHLVFLRVDHRRSDTHQLMARYDGQFFRWHDEPGGLLLAGSGTHYKNDVQTVLTTDRWQMSPGLLSEVRVQFARYVDVRQDLQPTVLVTRAGVSQQGGSLGAPGFGADPEDTWEGADIFSSVRGTHAMKFGGGTKYVRSHNPSLTYGRGAYFFAGPADQFPQPYLFIQGVAPTPQSAYADPRSLSAFGFIQDDWSIRPRLTFNLGLRYDIEKISNVRNYTAGVDANNLQPRIGAAFDLFGNGRTIVRAGGGVYTQQHLLYFINRTQIEGVDGTVTISLTPASPLFPQFPNVLAAVPATAPARDIYRVESDFRNPYALQASAGVEHVFRPATISADFIYLSGRDLMSLVDVNAPASNVKPFQRTVAQADATRPIPALPGTFRNIVTLGNLGRSWYRALQVKATRSTGRLQTLVSYTLSRAQDMDNYQLPEDSRNLAAEKARADADIRHNLTVGLTWQLPLEPRLLKGWTVSGIGTFRSNRPYTITWGDDRNGTTQNDARPGDRNTAQTGPYRNVDLSLSRMFSMHATTVEARVEAFNFFNAVNYDQYVGTLLSPLYSRPVSAFPMRHVQLAAIVRF